MIDDCTSGFLTAQCTEFVFGRGSARAPLGELTALPVFLVGLRGPTSKRRGGEGKERGRGKERKEHTLHTHPRTPSLTWVKD